MLRFPRNLKNLTFKGKPKWTYEKVTKCDLNKYIDVIMSHSSSLETLDFDNPYFDQGGLVDLSGFKALKRITMDPCMLMGETSTDPVARWREILPPNLEHIKFVKKGYNAEFPTMEMYELVRNGKLHLSSLTCEIYLDYKTAVTPAHHRK